MAIHIALHSTSSSLHLSAANNISALHALVIPLGNALLFFVIVILRHFRKEGAF